MERSNEQTSTKLQDTKEPYVFFDLELTAEEKAALEQLNIESKNVYKNYGELDKLTAELTNFIVNTLGNQSNLEICSVVVLSIVVIINKVLDYFNQESALIMLRSTPRANQEFDIPRWHTDASYYGRKFEDGSPIAPTGRQYKAAVTLIGPATLFYKLPSEQRAEFNQAFFEICKESPRLQLEKPFRKKVDGMLNDKSKIESPSPGQGALFAAGCRETSAVHSEPKITGKRLFLNIITGSKEEINETKPKPQLEGTEQKYAMK
jgi:hypothetical protein